MFILITLRLMTILDLKIAGYNIKSSTINVIILTIMSVINVPGTVKSLAIIRGRIKSKGVNKNNLRTILYLYGEIR